MYLMLCRWHQRCNACSPAVAATADIYYFTVYKVTLSPLEKSSSTNTVFLHTCGGKIRWNDNGISIRNKDYFYFRFLGFV